jgi:SAM-dependent methyltransferase
MAFTVPRAFRWFRQRRRVAPQSRSTAVPLVEKRKHEPGPAETVNVQRAAVATRFLNGRGVEVGAGDRPFPVPKHVEVLYGDIRDVSSVQTYFKTDDVRSGAELDAQTFAGIDNESLDFVISAHVIEHLQDPIGSIVNAIRVLRPGGVHILVVPDMRYTFDRRRPETTVEHILLDHVQGGHSTCQQSYEEHLRYVHPELTDENLSEAEIEWQSTESAKRWRDFDIHFHAWTKEGFEALLGAAAHYAPFTVEESVFAVNENIFVLRKNDAAQLQ